MRPMAANNLRSARRGFTLTEMVISVALVLMLIYGINRVFEITGKTVGTGQALASANRDVRAARHVLESDFAGILADEAPFMTLRSSRVTAFRNREDMETDLDFDPANPAESRVLTVDLDGDGIEGEPELDPDGNLVSVPGGETYRPAHVNHRSHRTDLFSFFSRGDFKRQTGNSAYGSFTSEMTAKNAWIWYGHLKLYNHQGDTADPANYMHPGYWPPTGTPAPNDANRSNLFGNQFALGRFAMLLAGRDQDNNVVDRTFHPTSPNNVQGFQEYIGENREDPSLGGTEWSPVDFGSAAPPVPLSPLASWPRPTPASPHWSSYAYGPDPGVAPADWDNYDATLTYDTWLHGQEVAIPSNAPAPAQEHLPIQSSRYDLAVVLNVGHSTPAVADPLAKYRERVAAAIEEQLSHPTLTMPDLSDGAVDTEWWQDDHWWWDGLIYRFESNPRIVRPITPERLAKAMPYFLSGASQFMVEYAGDFLRQTPDGDVADVYGYSYRYDDGSGVLRTRTELRQNGTDGEIDFVIPSYLGDYDPAWLYEAGNVVLNAIHNGGDGRYYRAVVNGPGAPPGADWAETQLPAKQIRWYGMPRDVAGLMTGGPDGKIPGYVINPTPFAPAPPRVDVTVGRHPNEMVDVIPLRDLVLYWMDWNGYWPIDATGFVNNPGHDPGYDGAPFERWADLTGPYVANFLIPRDDYLDPLAGMTSDEQYTCAWGPQRRPNPHLPDQTIREVDRKPRLVRFTIVLDDPVGRLPEGQTMQFVFALP